MKPGFEPPFALDARRFPATQFFPNRKDLVRALASRVPPGPRVVEVGVGLGDFSEYLLTTLLPAEFVAIDVFGMHQIEWLWGRKTAEIFKDRTHSQFYRERFAARVADGGMRVLEGMSWEQLDSMPRAVYDLIYVDAGHDFSSVTKDLEASLGCLAPGGVIVANDYTLYDPFLDVVYGVVQAVNLFVEKRDFVFDGFAMESNMFCDVAISRRT